jgi:hypothetical protein
VTGKMVCVCLTAKADFLISYEDARREIVELKGHVLKRGAWRASAEHVRKYRLTVLIMCERNACKRGQPPGSSPRRVTNKPLAGISLQV